MVMHTCLAGGALYTMGQVVLEVENCEFNSNVAVDGGAVTLASQGGATFKNSFFSDNHITPSTCHHTSFTKPNTNHTALAEGIVGSSTGGAVLSFTQVRFVDTNFAHNSAKDGGAVGLDLGTKAGYFQGCSFDGNWADRYGPDVFVRSTFDTTAYFQPFPTNARVYSQDAAQPLPQLSPSGPSPPLPPALPVQPRTLKKLKPSPGTLGAPKSSPTPPPSPAAPAASNDTTLWDMLQGGQSYVLITSHMKLSDASEWADQGPLEVSGNLAIIGNCSTPDGRCMLDASGLLPALFVVQVCVLCCANIKHTTPDRTASCTWKTCG